MIPVAEYTSSSVGDMLANYARIRAGFNRPQPRPVYIAPRPEQRKAIDATPLAEPSGPRGFAKRIIRETAERHNIKIGDIIGPRRFPTFTIARREAAWLIAAETDLYLAEIGRLLGKDHTTIINAVRVANEQTGTNVRGLGGPPIAKRLRDWESAAAASARYVPKRKPKA